MNWLSSFDLFMVLVTLYYVVDRVCEMREQAR